MLPSLTKYIPKSHIIDSVRHTISLPMELKGLLKSCRQQAS